MDSSGPDGFLHLGPIPRSSESTKKTDVGPKSLVIWHKFGYLGMGLGIAKP